MASNEEQQHNARSLYDICQNVVLDMLDIDPGGIHFEEQLRVLPTEITSRLLQM